ncbi:hypothetical protein O6H91_10G065800 [Diphasiastrum complanatum]|uniref:Uncharacterized protein n=1 Tax=Diphasiastrum complanatum TaxID=34168 RepID=A0ACC2CIS4_DIPCM|nr:hypothetical protein O6H91_10G065800 [Diphasiastrum complanatum]
MWTTHNGQLGMPTALGILFVMFAYERGSQSVMRVSQEDYHACRTSRPIEHHISGNTLVHLRRDDYYFISGVQGHCNAGMKLAVILAGGSPSAAPSTPVTVPPSSAPPLPTPTVAPTVPPALPPPAVTPVSPPTPAPVAPPTVAPVSTPIASPPPAPVSPPTAAPTSVPTPGAIPPSPPAPAPLSPMPPGESPLAAPPGPNAASALQSTFGAILIAAVGISYLIV